jgi:hypothetical protein
LAKVNEVQRVRQQQREALRWRVLNAAYNSKPIPISDGLILRIVNDTGFSVSVELVRETLDYLEGKELIAVKRRAVEWNSRITDEGVDVVEGNLECPDGIDRPEW